jgi:predicted ATP-dependent endonuclease of OLD family
MKISEIAIFDHKQFKEFVVDLTYPEGHPKEGKPLDKVCFIGTNGTGKTTILELLRDCLNHNSEKGTSGSVNIVFSGPKPKDFFYRLNGNTWEDIDYKSLSVRLSAINELLRTGEKSDLSIKEIYSTTSSIENKTKETERVELISIYSPSESIENLSLNIKDNFEVSLNDAIDLFKDEIPFNQEVSNQTIKNFWKVTTFQVKKREDDYRNFLKKDENRNKTVAEVEAEFDRLNPKILDKIAILWNNILEKAGLEFDALGASNPVQLTDNLKAYIRLKSNKQPIPYNELSTGIRNFIFKIGHIYSLYFNRNIESGFLMIDEPENSLFPDFLYDILGIYQEITQNTQIFMATHSPIIAAQFEPCERIILDFNDEGYVFARKGIVPTGDDPNDILSKDFGIRSLLGKEGVAKWERFIELKFLIKAETNIALKSDYINEYMEIGKAYNFGLDLKLKQDEANYQKA